MTPCVEWGRDINKLRKVLHQGLKKKKDMNNRMLMLISMSKIMLKENQGTVFPFIETERKIKTESITLTWLTKLIYTILEEILHRNFYTDKIKRSFSGIYSISHTECKGVWFQSFWNHMLTFLRCRLSPHNNMHICRHRSSLAVGQLQ